MTNEQEALRKIMNEYDRDRMRARMERDERVDKINSEYPELLETEKEISRLGMENFRKIIDDPSKSDEYNEFFEKKLSELKRKKERIIEENNIPKDYDEVKYKCEKCLDTGYIDTEKCPCFVQKIIKMHYELSNMKSMLHDFSEFSLDYYSDDYVESIGMTEKENMRDILDRAKKFCENDNANNLMFYGDCGLGKTFLSSCIAKRMLDLGKSVIYETSMGLSSDYEDYKFGRKEGSFDEIFDILYNADLLIIDDLGAEASNQISTQFFFDIVNKRTALSKKMIISTNLTIDGIREKYTDRLSSRIFESFEILRFTGKDIRIQNLTK